MESYQKKKQEKGAGKAISRDDQEATDDHLHADEEGA
jgi:hypothetical protein